MICVFILFLFFNKSEASLKLKFFDEFNETDSIDQNKWEVEHETGSCDGNKLNQFNCKTNNKTNIRIIDGTLALAAIRHKYLNKEYTAPTITTKQNFTYGRVEIRASLPKGKMLRPAIYLVPTNTNTEEWLKNGQIDILSNTQTQEIKYGIHSDEIPKHYLGNSKRIDQNLNEFQIYVLEWTQSEIIWKFNETLLETSIKTNEIFSDNYNPFSKPFRLRISLGVGGHADMHIFFPGETLEPQDADQWNCSLLILDYIRIYEYENDLSYNFEENTITSSEICRKVMPTIRIGLQKASLNMIEIISISSFLLLLAIIPFTIFLFIRMKRYRESTGYSERHEHKEEMELYDDAFSNDYINTYEAINYEEIQSTGQSAERNEKDNKYLTITNKYVTKP